MKYRLYIAYTEKNFTVKSLRFESVPAKDVGALVQQMITQYRVILVQVYENQLPSTETTNKTIA